MRSPNLYTFSFIENFFGCNFFFLERMEEYRDLAKKEKKKETKITGKRVKIMVVGVINAHVSGSHLL